MGKYFSEYTEYTLSVRGRDGEEEDWPSVLISRCQEYEVVDTSYPLLSLVRDYSSSFVYGKTILGSPDDPTFP